MSVLYVFDCPHGKRLNFLHQCEMCAKEHLASRAETIRTQQSTIDRLTEQRDRLLGHLKMAALAADEFWHEHYPECINSITSIIAEIEAKND